MVEHTAVCQSCKKRPAVPGKTRCQECREYHKEYYADKVARGICTQCHTRKARKGLTTCKICDSNRRTMAADLRKAGRCIKCRRPHDGTTGWCRDCLDMQRIRQQQKRDKVFEAYGGYHCVCCGESEPVFLEIDHINDDGAAHRRAIGGAGSFYNWLIKNNFPPGFQVLCANCNRAKRFGVCPHQLSTEARHADRNLPEPRRDLQAT